MFKPDVDRLKSRRNVGGLIKALRYGDSHVRYAAAKALGEIRDPSAVLPLIACFGDSAAVVEGAVSSLYEIGEPAVEGLAAVARVPVFRESAFRTLTYIGGPKAIAECKAALGDNDAAVREAAAEALRMIGVREVAGREEAKKRAEYAKQEKLLRTGSCARDGHMFGEGVYNGFFHRCRRCGAMKHVHSGNIMPGPGQ